MPNFNMGETLKIDRGGLFVKLKSKGDKVKFRLVKGGYYDGKHFIKNGDKWVVSECPRVMHELSCEYCNKCSDLKIQADLIKDEKEKKDALKVADGYKVKMTFYYPIIDREDQKGKILKTTLSVRQELEAEYKEGIDVYEYDYILTRTEESPSKYYKLIRLDSKKCEPLTNEEVLEMGNLENSNLEELITGAKPSEQTFGKDKVEDIIIDEKEEMPFLNS